MTAPKKEDVIKYLMQLRKHLVHALQQPNISPKRFNECREQLLPLDEQLRMLGVTDLPLVPQMSASYVRPSRYQRRQRMRGDKFNSYENRIKRKFERANSDE